MYSTHVDRGPTYCRRTFTNRTVFVAAGVAVTAPPEARTAGVDVAAASAGETMVAAAMVGGDVERRTRQEGGYYHMTCVLRF